MSDLSPVDYLLVGHIAVDVTPSGRQLGGTVSYSALAAKALGLRVGIVTAVGADVPLRELDGVQILNTAPAQSTVFENIYTAHGRKQVLHQQAAQIEFSQIPAVWHSAPIVHIAPIAQEVDDALVGDFPNSWVGVTPQGWMRTWDENGSVLAKAWENSEQVLSRAGGVVLSIEDINRDLETVEWMAHHARLLCLTEGEEGAVLHWNGDRRRFRPNKMNEADATGAGDLFAAGFFARLFQTKDPWEAARFATHFASYSVSRVGLLGIPTQEEIELCKMEVLS